jgi:hypothetical protein
MYGGRRTLQLRFSCENLQHRYFENIDKFRIKWIKRIKISFLPQCGGPHFDKKNEVVGRIKIKIDLHGHTTTSGGPETFDLQHMV